MSSSTSNATKSATSDWFLLHARMPGISNPVIYRQLLVPPKMTLPELHTLMVSAFGWASTHLHVWECRKVEAIKDSSTVLTSDLNPGGFTLPNVKMGHQCVTKIGKPFQFSEDDDFGLPNDWTISTVEQRYKLSENKHILHYEYDMGDGWEHLIFVERRIPEAEVLALEIMQEGAKGKGTKRTATGEEKEGQNQYSAKITEGFGHGVAEDCGSYPGWESVIEAYKVQGTNKDKKQFKEQRAWYEKSCSNGDPKGLKGKERLEHFDVKEANDLYEELKNMVMDHDEDEWY